MWVTGRFSTRVYPRVCGGTRQRQRLVWRAEGLSPRVRGNHLGNAGRCDVPGSIPACAGEPTSSTLPSSGWRVYPRVCGGTIVYICAGGIVSGLSPRVRGNHVGRTGVVNHYRSIPACAGEPVLVGDVLYQHRVYPRVCGGTYQCAGPGPGREGLSPRVRGNQRNIERGELYEGSIPACAGEPNGVVGVNVVNAVYPRVCGGTAVGRRARQRAGGLSPRVRGNPLLVNVDPARQGSIPACAGEPSLPARRRKSWTVYPRVCGGTLDRHRRNDGDDGLSPRVRGNRFQRRRSWRRRRSIPACAGEPPRAWKGSRTPGVYPRVCGGTLAVATGGFRLMGLSPRVRGNP